MRKCTLLAILVASTLLGGRASKADLVLSISSPDDLTQLVVGATATFDISVAGTASDAPGYLDASVQFDPAIFGNPVITAGPIVPDVNGFTGTTSGVGTVDGSYDDSIFSTAPITTDGLFYSFTLTRLAGSATVLSFFSFSAMDDNGGAITVSTDPDSLSVAAAPAGTVPEPSSLLLAILGGLSMVCGRRWRTGWADLFRRS